MANELQKHPSLTDAANALKLMRLLEGDPELLEWLRQHTESVSGMKRLRLLLCAQMHRG